MRRVPAALVALVTAAALVVLALPASAATSRSFGVSPTTVRAGQQVKVFGKGCRSKALVRIYLSGIEIDDSRADRAGAFNDEVEIPASVDPGQYRMKAGCSGRGLGSVKITVLRSRFSVSPRTVAPGETIKVTGPGCKPGSYVTVKLDGRKIEDGRANRKGIGIHLGSNGARQSNVRHNLFIANNEFTGPGGGNGIYSSEAAQRVLLADNRFEDHNGAGVLFADHLDVPQRDVRVERNRASAT
jgi:hypothetical protein